MRAQICDRVDGLAADGSGHAVGAVAQDAYSLGGVGEVEAEVGHGERPGHSGLPAAVADLPVVAAGCDVLPRQ